jgi:AcrR family transcriptional regulator
LRTQRSDGDDMLMRVVRYWTQACPLSINRRIDRREPPMPTKPSPDDRRTQRTRVALRQALLELMHEGSWDDIDVQNICERANIGRSTFYTHFANKDALLSGSFDDLRQGLRKAHAAKPSGPAGGPAPLLKFVRGLMEHGYENRRLFRTLVGRRSGYLVHQRFREAIVKMVDDDLVMASPDIPRPAAVRWIAAALFELMTWWLESRSPMPVEELHQLFEKMVAPLAATGRHEAHGRGQSRSEGTATEPMA